MGLIHELADYFLKSFIPDWQTSLSRVLDAPFACYYLPGKTLTAFGCPPVCHVWLRFCGIGSLLALISGLFCLAVVPKGMPGKRTALLSLFCTPLLLDCAFGLRDRPVAAAQYAFLPVLICLVLLGWKTVSLACRRREVANSFRPLVLYSIGLLANGLAFAALFTFFLPAWHRCHVSIDWRALLSPFPEIWLVEWFFPLDSIRAVASCAMSVGGIWICLCCSALFCSPLLGTWPERKPALVCLLWFTYLFHFSLAFWVDGYSVRSVVYVFLPALAAMAMTVFLLVQAVIDKKRSRRKRQIILLGISIPAEIMAFLLMFGSVNYGAFGASC